jgi:hypothetical protein
VNNQFGSDPNHLPEVQLRGSANLPTITDLQDQTNTDLNTPLIILDGFEITLTRMMDLNTRRWSRSRCSRTARPRPSTALAVPTVSSSSRAGATGRQAAV